MSSNSKLIVEKCQRLIQVHWHAYLLASWVIGYSLMMEVTKKKTESTNKESHKKLLFLSSPSNSKWQTFYTNLLRKETHTHVMIVRFIWFFKDNSTFFVKRYFNVR